MIPWPGLTRLLSTTWINPYVILKEWVTNEMVEQLGDQFQIYTFSEAIQASGLSFDEALITG